MRIGGWRGIVEDVMSCKWNCGVRASTHPAPGGMDMATNRQAEQDRSVADSEMLADLAACDAARAEGGEGMPLAVF